MFGLGTLARVTGELRRDVRAVQERDPAARCTGSLEILATFPGVHALLAHRVAHALHEAGVPSSRGRWPRRRAAWTGIEIHPAARIGPSLFIDHGAGRRRRRDGRDRRERDALPGRDARRHRLCHRQAPPDARGQRDRRLGRQAARPDHGRARLEGRRQLRRHPRRPAELDRRRQPRASRPGRGPPARGPRRRLGPPARPAGRRDQGPRRAGSARSSAPSPSVAASTASRRESPLRPVRGPNPAGG